MRKLITIFWLVWSVVCSANIDGQRDTVHFTLSFQDPVKQKLKVSMSCKNNGQDSMVFMMPQWTPGYYQMMNYGEKVSSFQATGDGKSLRWQQRNNHCWVVQTKGCRNILLDYEVLADRAFVATSILDSNHAYITPAATFLYIQKKIQTPVTLKVLLYKGWNRIVNGLDSIAQDSYFAPDFDMLYDCPILAGNLEEFPSFKVSNILHRFIAYKPGELDRDSLMKDLKRIVEASVKIIGHIPYAQYTFLGIGPGNGGIEHLTSSANSFTGDALKTSEGRKSMLSFLTHEYFHNFNVKSVRPIELGPFDYERGSKTKQLWVSEGWTVYYEYLITKRTGIISDNDLYNNLRNNILSYELHDGKNHQSLIQSSAETWTDGPFGNDPDKTISYYNKGPIVALMLDFAIRHHTKNKRSLDDVMRKLYEIYYQQKKRGFTEFELRKQCEKIAGKELPELFSYVYTTQSLDYSKYFNYGGLEIKTADHSFTIKPMANPDSLQASILKSWLGK